LLVIKQYSVPYGTAVSAPDRKRYAVGWLRLHLMGVTQSVEGGVAEEKEVTQDF